MKKNIRLILTDMDGTLLNNHKALPVNTIEMIQRCQKQGIIFGAASGRQMSNIQHYFQEHEVYKEMFFVAENGAYASYQGEVIHFSALNSSYVPDLIQIARGLTEAWPVLCSAKTAYIESNDPRLLTQCKKYYEKLEVVEDLLAIQDEFCKLSICALKGSEETAWPAFLPWTNRLQITVSADIWLDICNLNECKGKPVALFQDKMNIAIEETMAFGDYLNDVTLLPRAKYSYAMANAHPDLIQLAQATAPSNEEGGVIQIVEQFLNEQGGKIV